jgi:cell surface protein SprA
MLKKPAGISNEDLSFNKTRRILAQELYPLTDIAQGQSQVVNTLDLSYYSSDRVTVIIIRGALKPENFKNYDAESTNFEQGNGVYSVWASVGNGQFTIKQWKIYFQFRRNSRRCFERREEAI